VNGLSAPSHVELAHKPALVSVMTMTNLAKALNLNLVTLKIATNLQLINPLRVHHLLYIQKNLHLPHRMIINLLKFHLIKVARVNLAVMKVNLVATKTVVSAITATGVNGASAHKTAVLVPKPALVKFWDHPTAPNVRKLRSHSHATLVLARTAVKQPLQATTTDLFINEVLFDYYY